jgi:hypothetical protein
MVGFELPINNAFSALDFFSLDIWSNPTSVNRKIIKHVINNILKINFFLRLVH